MSDYNKKLFNVLDGNDEESNKIVNDFLDTISDKDKNESMSHEYDYLDE